MRESFEDQIKPRLTQSRFAGQNLSTLKLAAQFIFLVAGLGSISNPAAEASLDTPPLSISPASPKSEGRPLWQFGFGAGAGVTPHYPASDESSLRFLASPTFRYRGRVLRSDDEGTRARLLTLENAEIDVSGAASFPVGGSENKARQGMRQLDWIGEVGPRLNVRWKFQNAGKLRDDRLRLSIPIRAVASSDGSNLAHRGFIFQPGLSFERILDVSNKLKSEISVEVDTYVSLIDKTLANYYFGVAPFDATPFRRSFDAAPGILTVSSGLTFYVSPKDISNNGSSFFVGVRNATTAWSANRDSPLHRSDQQFIFYAGFNLLIWNSGAREAFSGPQIAPHQPQPMRE